MTDCGKLAEALRRLADAPHPPRPWRDGDKIPWHDPEFSRRLMPVHLDQDNHMASRSFEVIGRHVDWLLEVLPAGTGDPGPYQVLDLGCGPGFYCHELARRGHRADGVDFGPAAIRHARATADARGLPCRFWEEDLTDPRAAWRRESGPVDAVTFWFGEMNAFEPAVIRELLTAAVTRLRPGGLFVLEFQPEELFLDEDAQEWRTCERSVFRDGLQLWLQEYHWDAASRSEITVHWILDAATGALDRYVQCHRAWSEEEIVDLLLDCGLEAPILHPPITGCDERLEFPVAVASKPSA
ncbi:MAG TPA: class I SAM-dependent methyltransferase [Candidatus Krumholzibacteria bacterium]|nr:class I SAM-dependent methyltransferase [Candidatus Krumholzibacteria bacterium]HRX50805.1 class I SAM-dependent methyltransferase [Candidatus Krumholzibacteria bacterium]